MGPTDRALLEFFHGMAWRPQPVRNGVRGARAFDIRGKDFAALARQVQAQTGPL